MIKMFHNQFFANVGMLLLMSGFLLSVFFPKFLILTIVGIIIGLIFCKDC